MGTAPGHGAIRFEIKVRPVLPNPVGCVVHGVEPPRRRVRIWTFFSRSIRRQKDLGAIMEDQLLKSLQEAFTLIIYASGMG